MTDQTLRKPVSNFLIKRSFQIKMILKILFVMFTTGLITTIIVAWAYNARSVSGSFYYMSNDVMQDLELTSVLGIILPALLAAQAVSFIMAFAIGLFSSRKAAVPIYKIEKWAQQLRTGNLNTRLAFREQEEMSDLTRECNAAVDYYRRVFGEIRATVAAIEEKPADERGVRIAVAALKKTLSTVIAD